MLPTNFYGNLGGFYNQWNNMNARGQYWNQDSLDAAIAKALEGQTVTRPEQAASVSTAPSMGEFIKTLPSMQQHARAFSNNPTTATRRSPAEVLRNSYDVAAMTPSLSGAMGMQTQVPQIPRPAAQAQPPQAPAQPQPQAQPQPSAQLMNGLSAPVTNLLNQGKFNYPTGSM